MKQGYLIVFLVIMGSLHLSAQKLLGVVMETNPQGVEGPLPGATVRWLGVGTGATTKDNGAFLIDRVEGVDKLVVSFVGYKTDTIDVGDRTNIKVELKPEQMMQEVTVQGWKPTSRIDYASGINRVVMDEKELFKAACCNLSESFETNPSVDVAFTDALTGTRQIQMLGLAGPNTMITVENIPGVRGLASSQGIQFIPGSWINSIQVTKGVGSVINGYESIAGQINVELKKPQESDKVFLNGYVNSAVRTEMNLITTMHTGKKWATTFLLHGSARPMEMDQNKDSFLDFPMGSQVNFTNRWVYNSGSGWLSQLSFNYLNDQKEGGQTGYHAEHDKFTTNRYGLEINTKRYEFTGKLGYQFPSQPYKSVGLQVNAVRHEYNSYYGFNVHDGREQSAYANLIYQSIIRNTSHKFKTGVSFLYDDVEETLGQANTSNPVLDFGRKEAVPGAFFEYAYDDLKKFSLIAAVRVDQHNLFGTFFIPRVHTKYNITENTMLRASMGRGIRVANVIMENTGFLASSRALVFQNQQTTNAYGYKPDRAWNYGLNFTQDFTLDYRPGTLSLDYFFTNFQNQVVVDYDKSPQQVNIYALNGKSFSHSVQAQLDYQLFRRFDLRLAYRWLDVETDYAGGRRQRPLIPRDRSFVNLAYATKSNWKFDYTIQWLGKQRLPMTETNPEAYQLNGYSPRYMLMNAQVTKDFKTTWSVYAGVENIANFRLDNPIVAANDPFGPYFDSSMVWGPVFGRMIYAGFRYRMK